MNNKKYIFFALAAAVLFGASIPASKYLLTAINPIFLASIYYLGAAVLLIPFSCRNFKNEYSALKSNKRDLVRLLGAIVTGGIGGPILLLYGIKLMNATGASLLLNVETVATTIIAALLFREHISKNALLASIIVLAAGVILVFGGSFKINVGGVFVVLGCFAWGFDNNFTATVQGISSTSITIVKGIVAGTFNLVLAMMLYEISLNNIYIIYAVIVGFFSYGLSIVLYIASAKSLGASRSQIIFAANPFIGVILSYMFFLDPLSVKFYVALILMITGVVLLYLESHEHYHVHEAVEHEHEHGHEDGHHFHSHEGIPRNKSHIHVHRHDPIVHSHHHFPDIHHRHAHR